MSWKPVLLLVLALAVLGGSPPTVTAGSEEDPAVRAAEEAEAADPLVVVYYFHGERRCKTCRTIEAFAEETVRGRFAKQLDSGELAWRAVNFELPENEHFIEEFGLVSSSLVLVEMRDGKPAKFEVLQKAWSLVRDRPGFEQYVADAVRGYLG
jgi:hypothetical protein